MSKRRRAVSFNDGNSSSQSNNNSLNRDAVDSDDDNDEGVQVQNEKWSLLLFMFVELKDVPFCTQVSTERGEAVEMGTRTFSLPVFLAYHTVDDFDDNPYVMMSSVSWAEVASRHVVGGRMRAQLISRRLMNTHAIMVDREDMIKTGVENAVKFTGRGRALLTRLYAFVNDPPQPPVFDLPNDSRLTESQVTREQMHEQLLKEWYYFEQFAHMAYRVAQEQAPQLKEHYLHWTPLQETFSLSSPIQLPLGKGGRAFDDRACRAIVNTLGTGPSVLTCATLTAVHYRRCNSPKCHGRYWHYADQTHSYLDIHEHLVLEFSESRDCLLDVVFKSRFNVELDDVWCPVCDDPVTESTAYECPLFVVVFNNAPAPLQIPEDASAEYDCRAVQLQLGSVPYRLFKYFERLPNGAIKEHQKPLDALSAAHPQPYAMVFQRSPLTERSSDINQVCTRLFVEHLKY